MLIDTINKGFTYSGKGKYEKAIKQFEIAIKQADEVLRSHPDQAVTRLKFIAHSGKGESLYSRKDYIAAEDEYNIVLEKDANNTMALAFKGILMQKRPDGKATDNELEAERCFGELLRQAQESAAALTLDMYDCFAFGTAYHATKSLIKTDKYPKAIKWYDKAIQIRGQNQVTFIAKCYVARGITLNSKKDNVNAIDSFNKAIGIESNHLSAYIDKAKTFASMGKYEDAISTIDIAISLKPSDFRSHYNKGLILNEKGVNKEALKSFERALELIPAPEAYCNVAWGVYKTDRSSAGLSKALDLCKKALLLAQEDPYLLDTTGCILRVQATQLQGDADAARALLADAISYFTAAKNCNRNLGDKVLYLCNMSVTYASLEDYQSAATSLEEARTILESLDSLDPLDRESQITIKNILAQGEYGIVFMVKKLVELLGLASNMLETGYQNQLQEITKIQEELKKLLDEVVDVVDMQEITPAESIQASNTKIALLEVRISKVEQNNTDIAAEQELLKARQEVMYREFKEQLGLVKKDLDALDEIRTHAYTLQTLIAKAELKEAQDAEKRKIKENAYQHSFYKEIISLLNGAYIVSEIVSTGLIKHDVTGTTGKIGVIAKIFSGLIPHADGVVKVFCDLLIAVDYNNQTKMIKRFKEVASTATEMEQLAEQLAIKLVLNDLNISGRKSSIMSKLAIVLDIASHATSDASRKMLGLEQWKEILINEAVSKVADTIIKSGSTDLIEKQGKEDGEIVAKMIIKMVFTNKIGRETSIEHYVNRIAAFVEIECGGPTIHKVLLRKALEISQSVLDGIKQHYVRWDEKQDREKAFLSSLAQSLGDNEEYYAFEHQIVTRKLVEKCGMLVTHAQGIWHKSAYKLNTNFIGHQEVIDGIVKSVVSDLGLSITHSEETDQNMHLLAQQAHESTDA